MKILACLLILLAFLKANFYLRIFDGFSFLVSMLLGAFLDLRYFLAFFGFVILTFSLMLFVLVPQAYGHYSTSLSYFIIALRTSLGDNDMNDYSALEPEEEASSAAAVSGITWFVWVLIMVVGNVVFMNFIVAVVSESYEKCMQSQVIEKYKLRVEMILERERTMSPAEFKNPAFFPRALVVREA
jgi:hypothetical protein